MTTFDRYLSGRLLVQFGFFALVLVAVYWVNRAVRLFDALIADGSNVLVFLEFTALVLPSVIVAVLPVAALVAAIYGINRLAGDSELVVAQTAGLGPWHLLRPVAVFGVAVAAMVSILAHGLVPSSRTALAERGREVAQDVTARLLREGEFLHPGPGVTVYVREISPEGELLGLYLQDRRAQGTTTSYTAEQAFLVRGEAAPRLVMLRGQAQTLDVGTRSLLTVSFDDFAFDLAELGGADGARRLDPRELATPLLLAASPLAQEATGDDRASLLQEGHSRFAAALLAAALPVMALGIMLSGGYSRMGLWRQMLAAVTVAVLAQLATNAAEGGARGDAEAWWVLYAPPVLTLAVGLAALALAARSPTRGAAAA